MNILILGELLVLAILGAPFASAEQPCYSISDLPTYEGSPADVSVLTTKIIAAVNGSVFAVNTWSDDVTRHTRFIKTADGIQWRGVVRPYGIAATDDLLTIVQSHGSTILFRQGAGNGTIERSIDNGRNWVRLRFDIDQMPSRDWIRTKERTAGAELVAHFAAVKSGSPATIYATFQIWVPEASNQKVFSHWKDIDGMYVSLDAGESWRLLSRDLIAGSPLGVGGPNPRFIVGLGKEGLIGSQDGGRTWAVIGRQDWVHKSIEITGRQAQLDALAAKGEVLPRGLREGVPLRIYEILLSPSNTALLYLRTNIGLVTSLDSGQHWEVCPVGGKTFDMVNAAVFLPGNPNALLLSTNVSANSRSRVWRSLDGGQTYTSVYTAPGLVSAKAGSHSQ